MAVRTVRVYRWRGVRAASWLPDGSARLRASVRRRCGGFDLHFAIQRRSAEMVCTPAHYATGAYCRRLRGDGVGSAVVSRCWRSARSCHPHLVGVGALGLVIPNAPALALSRHPEASCTAAAMLGAAQFGSGAAVAPAVGALGNNATALSIVMTAAIVAAGIALLALAVLGEIPQAVVEPASPTRGQRQFSLRGRSIRSPRR